MVRWQSFTARLRSNLNEGKAFEDDDADDVSVLFEVLGEGVFVGVGSDVSDEDAAVLRLGGVQP